MGIIDAEAIGFSYDGGVPALDGVSLTIREGEFLAIVGNNGSGKSTLARHFNALLPCDRGSLRVAGLDAADSANLWAVRKACGMVFQNPDNQFVSSVAGEDVAFGLQNFDFPDGEIPARVAAALDLVHLPGFEERDPHTLSGGQKQRLAIAGVLAVEPDIVVFDEATAMLDPEGRQQVLQLVGELHQRGTTVVMITHYIEEAVGADRVAVMDAGRLLACGAPQEVLTDRGLMEQARLEPPLATRLCWELEDMFPVKQHAGNGGGEERDEAAERGGAMERVPRETSGGRAAAGTGAGLPADRLAAPLPLTDEGLVNWVCR